MSGDKVKLRSSDEQMFEVNTEVALESETIKNLIEETGMEHLIPMPNVKGSILAKVIEYCRAHVDARKPTGNEQEEKKAKPEDDDMKSWDTEYIKVDQATLFDLILAANYLNIKGLLDLACQTVADMIKEKTPEEIRKIFKIENDFTPEEEETVRRENQWAFD